MAKMKKIPCQKCEGKGRIWKTWMDEDGEACAKTVPCDQCNGTGKIEVPMTNLDRIRAMTVEELGIFLGEWADSNKIWKRDGLGEVLYWLLEPAEEETDE